MGFEMLDLFFFPEGSGFSILLENGDHPCYFSFEFSFYSPLSSVCVLVFQSTWPSRTFIILKDTNLGTGICLISDFLACHRDDTKSHEKCPPSKKLQQIKISMLVLKS